MFHLLFAALAGSIVPHVTLAPPAVEFVGAGRIDGDTIDLSGLTDTLALNCPHNRLGGFGSAIAHLANDRFLVLADRGPGDGAAWYECRFHEVSIFITPGSPHPIRFKLDRTILLTNELGRPFYGVASALKPSGPRDGSRDQRLDPEGIALAPNGTIYISDEYGPHILAFRPDGTLLKRLPVPSMFAPASRSSDEVMEGPPHNTIGRQPNRGFEGLTLNNQGHLVALLQSPLLQDSPFDELNERAGKSVRALVIDPKAETPPTQWVYPLSAPTMGLNEILWVDECRYLVIERDNKDGTQARRKWITLVDSTKASDVSAQASLPVGPPPSGTTSATTTRLIDLLDPSYGLLGPAFPAKVEGLAFAPVKPEWGWPSGDRLLLVLSDNDFKAGEDTFIWAFRIPRERLAGSVAIRESEK